MNVYVTQGHEHGIGLEVFLKSCLLLSHNQLNKICLIGFKESVTQTAASMNIPFKIKSDFIQFAHVEIPAIWLTQKNHSQSYEAVIYGMKLAEKNGALYTLPTSKDQLHGYKGHTDLLRGQYRCDHLGMFFSGYQHDVLLITDHVPISKVSRLLTFDKITKTILLANKTLKSWGWGHSDFILSGINPHAGEQGLIGNEDGVLAKSIKYLRSLNIKCLGPFSGDTLISASKKRSDILVYMFHDQGLGVFKSLNGIIGSNITLGLPYPRFSPDHGTSFSLYKKNVSDYRGCLFSLKQALHLTQRNIYG